MDEAQMIRLVRRTVADADGTLFTDLDVTDALAMHGAESGPHTVKLTAADLLDQIAVSEVLISKKLTTQDLSTDGPAVSKELREHAKRLRAEVAKEKADEDPDAVGFFHVIPGGVAARAEGEEFSWPR